MYVNFLLFLYSLVRRLITSNQVEIRKKKFQEFVGNFNNNFTNLTVGGLGTLTFILFYGNCGQTRQTLLIIKSVFQSSVYLYKYVPLMGMISMYTVDAIRRESI